MTLILSIQTKDSIWMLADRRLSYPNRKPIEDAIKASIVDVNDGIALIGYAGLGATALGNQPSKWLVSVLRGRHHKLEAMLRVIAEAMQREFLPHLRQISDVRQRAHSFVIPCFVEGECRLYLIELQDAPSGPSFRFVRVTRDGKTNPHRVFAIGAGAAYLQANAHWVRPLLHLVKAYNRKKISAQQVSDRLASINFAVHQSPTQATVGPDSVVIWRNSRNGRHRGGGGHAVYDGTVRSPDAPMLPTIISGMDFGPIAAILMEHAMIPMQQALSSTKNNEQPDLPMEKINRLVSELPSSPDEKLR